MSGPVVSGRAGGHGLITPRERGASGRRPRVAGRGPGRTGARSSASSASFPQTVRPSFRDGGPELPALPGGPKEKFQDLAGDDAFDRGHVCAGPRVCWATPHTPVDDAGSRSRLAHRPTAYSSTYGRVAHDFLRRPARCFFLMTEAVLTPAALRGRDSAAIPRGRRPVGWDDWLCLPGRFRSSGTQNRTQAATQFLQFLGNCRPNATRTSAFLPTALTIPGQTFRRR